MHTALKAFSYESEKPAISMTIDAVDSDPAQEVNDMAWQRNVNTIIRQFVAALTERGFDVVEHNDVCARAYLHNPNYIGIDQMQTLIAEMQRQES